MKSQDILVLFKLVTQRQAAAQRRGARLLAQSTPTPRDWQGWQDSDDDGALVLEDGIDGELDRALTIRGLETSLRLSKSEISHSLRRSMATGLATRSRADGLPRANTKALFLFVLHGLKYVYPASPAATMRGIPTGISAPVLSDAIAVAGEAPVVWPDPLGSTQGQSIKPLYRTVPYAVRRDSRLYELLALTDAIRLGQARELSVAANMLEAALGAI